MSATTFADYAKTLTNPLDLAEELIEGRNWLVDRPAEEELIAEVEGSWCNMRIWFAWQPDLDALMFTCAYDTKIATHARPKIHPLLAAINERLWLGHFDVGAEDGVVMFRHGLLLRGNKQGVPVEQIEDLIDIAISECNRFYPAFQSVLWGGASIEHALTTALLDTVGEA